MDIVIADDEPLARERLRRMVEQMPACRVAGEAGDGEAALAQVRQCRCDVVLLDIHMPGTDGLQVAAELAGLAVPPAVILITAHMEHALSAHNVAVAGYLLKPVNRDDLANALARARRPSRAQLDALEAARGDAEQRFVTARTHDGHVRVALADVIYFRAEQKYTIVCHMQGELLIEEALNSLEQRFADTFLRVHRQVLVARRRIMALQAGDGGRMQLRLRHCDHLLPVSRRRLAEVRQCLC